IQLTRNYTETQRSASPVRTVAALLLHPTTGIWRKNVASGVRGLPEKRRPGIAARPVQQGGITTWGAGAPPRGQLVWAAHTCKREANRCQANPLCASCKSHRCRGPRCRVQRFRWDRMVAIERLDLCQKE